MNPAGEWIVALASGVLAFLVAVFFLPDLGHNATAPDDPEFLPMLPSHLRTPFQTTAASDATIVVLDPRGHLARGDEGVAGEALWATLGEGTADVRLATLRHEPDAHCPQGPCGLDIRHAAVADDAPRLMVDHRTQARLSVYVFDDVGSLLATTGNDTRFGTPSIRLPALWHFGEGPAPEGHVVAADVGQGILRDSIPLLEGLPVGGIASARIERHPYASFIGPITVTVQVDEIA